MPDSYYYIKIFYIGDNYYGTARQPGLKTIEGQIINALRQKGYIPKEDYLGRIPVHIAGRTDRFVHARTMVFGFLNFRKLFFPMEINSVLSEDIMIWAYSLVHNREEIMNLVKLQNTNDSIEKHDLNNLILKNVKHPRNNAKLRHYKYFHREDNGFDFKKIKMASKKLLGTHNFSNFCKPEENRKTIRRIDRIDIERTDEFLIFNFKAPSFLWKQIRKTIDVLLKIGNGEWPINYIEKLFNPNEKKISAMIENAPADRLILWDIVYPKDIKFIKCEKSIKYITKNLKKKLERLKYRTGILNSLKKSF
ncbi:MAG: tRNA pseudouridine synthase A [Promethearchaeota archaeon]